MSYILDALRRAHADRERQRGTVPGLHAPPVAPEWAAPAPDEPAWRRPWLVTAAVLAASGAAAWWVWPRDEVPPPALAAAPVTSPAAAPVAAVPPAPPRVAPVTAPAPAPAAAAAPPPVPSPPPPARPESPPASPPVAAAPAPRPAPAPAAASAAAPVVHAVHELPEAVRRELPVLTIGGAVYAQTPADRLLILGGQVFREGEQPAPGLTLERIRPRAAEFSFRGYRYEVPF